MGEAFRDRLQELEIGGLDELAADRVDRPVVDRLLEVVIHARRLQVREQLDVDLEGLGGGAFLGGQAVVAHEAHRVEDDAVAHGPSSGGGRAP